MNILYYGLDVLFVALSILILVGAGYGIYNQGKSAGRAERENSTNKLLLQDGLWRVKYERACERGKAWEFSYYKLLHNHRALNKAIQRKNRQIARLKPVKAPAPAGQVIYFGQIDAGKTKTEVSDG